MLRPMTIAPRRAPRTHTDERLAAAEEAHASDPERADMIARVRRFKASWYELGSALTEMRRTDRFKQWGFKDFEDYCRRELHLKRETADKLTGSYAFLRRAAPEVLERDGREAPIPSYQAVDFWRRAEEDDESEATPEVVSEIRRAVLDEGTDLPKLSRIYRQVVFPVGEEDQTNKRRQSLKQTVNKLVELLALARDEKLVPPQLCAEVEEPLQRLAAALK
jgi:hypothetical protein